MTTTIEETEDQQSATRSKRQEIRRRIAAAQLHLDRISELQNLSADADRRIDEAVNQHACETGPIQAALKSLERDELDRIVAKAGADEQAETRRRELLVQLHDANAKMESAIERLRREKVLLNGEIVKMVHDLKDSPSRLQLELVATAPEGMQVALFVAERTKSLASRRVEVAREQVSQLEVDRQLAQQRRTRRSNDFTGWNEVNGRPGDNAGQDSHTDAKQVSLKLSRWNAELAAAVELLARAESECESHRQAMIEVD